MEARFVAQYTDGHCCYQKSKFVGQIRVVYQKTGQRRDPAEQKERKIEDGVQIVLIYLMMLHANKLE